MTETKEKGLKVKLFNNNYFLIIKEEGFYLKNKTPNKKFSDLFIPYNEINFWEGICKEHNFFLKFKYKTLFKIYIFLSFLFIIAVPKSNFFIFFISLLFLFFVWFVFYIKTNYLVVYADYERIPIQIDDNKKLCFLINILNRKVKRKVKDKILFVFKYKIKEMKDLKDELKNNVQKDNK